MVLAHRPLLAISSAAIVATATLMVTSDSPRAATWSAAGASAHSSLGLVTVRLLQLQPDAVRAVVTPVPRPAVPVAIAPKHAKPAHKVHATATAGTGPRKAVGPRSYRISGVVRGGQGTIDACRYVLWQGPAPGGAGTTWIAAHNYCHGRYFAQWWAYLPVGAHVTVSGLGRTATYVVTGRRYLGRQTGFANGYIYGNLVLQTCKGTGTEFTYATLIS
jgi:hypothetical protein